MGGSSQDKDFKIAKDRIRARQVMMCIWSLQAIVLHLTKGLECAVLLTVPCKLKLVITHSSLFSCGLSRTFLTFFVLNFHATEKRENDNPES